MKKDFRGSGNHKACIHWLVWELQNYVYYRYFTPLCLLMLAISLFPAPTVRRAASVPDCCSSFPRLPRSPQRSAVGGFLMGTAWDMCGYLCCTCLANTLHHLSLLLAFVLRVSHVACLCSGLALGRHWSWLEAFTGFTGVLQKCTQAVACKSFPLGCWHCERQTRQPFFLSFCLSSPVGGKSLPAIPGFCLFSTLQFIFPFHPLRKCMSRFLKSRFHPLQAVLKANSLLPLQRVTSAMHQGALCIKELQMEHSSLCSPGRRNEQSVSAHHCSVHSHCAPSATAPCFLKPDWSKGQKEHFFISKKWTKFRGGKGNCSVHTFSWGCCPLALR